jgi:hypothetical protein
MHRDQMPSSSSSFFCSLDGIAAQTVNRMMQLDHRIYGGSNILSTIHSEDCCPLLSCDLHCKGGPSNMDLRLKKMQSLTG